MSRLLLLSASMGGGHDTVAAELARRLRGAGHRTRTVDVLALLPHPVGAAVRAFYQTSIRHAPAVYGGIYAAFFRHGNGPRPGSAPLADLARGPLLDQVARTEADAVVSVFHLAAQLTGGLRQQRALNVPSAVVVTDFAVHRQWLHPGNDLYLCLTDDLARRTRRLTGRPAIVSGALVSPRFTATGAALRARSRSDAGSGPGDAFGPDEAWGGDGEPVLVSAGAWGAGTRLEATARLLAAAGYRPVVLCGRNERLRRRLARHSGIHARGWVDDMPALMARACALIDNAAGQTALEALALGLPVIGYRPLPGHGAEGVRRMATLGLTEYAPGPWELLQSLDRLTSPNTPRTEPSAPDGHLFAADPIPALTKLATPRE